MPRPVALSTVSKKVSLLNVQHWRESFMPSFSEAESSRFFVGASAPVQGRADTIKPTAANVSREVFMGPRGKSVRRGEGCGRGDFTPGDIAGKQPGARSGRCSLRLL